MHLCEDLKRQEDLYGSLIHLNCQLEQIKNFSGLTEKNASRFKEEGEIRIQSVQRDEKKLNEDYDCETGNIIFERL